MFDRLGVGLICGVVRAVDQYLMGQSNLPAPDMQTQLMSSAG